MLPTCGALPTVRPIACEADPQLSTSGGGSELCQPLVAVETLLDGLANGHNRHASPVGDTAHRAPARRARARASPCAAQRVEHRERGRRLRPQPRERAELHLVRDRRRARRARAPGRPSGAAPGGSPATAARRAARRARGARRRAPRGCRARRPPPPRPPATSPGGGAIGAGEHPPVAVEHRDRRRGDARSGSHATGTRSVHADDDRRRQLGAHLRPGDRGQRLDAPGDRALVEEEQRLAVGDVRPRPGSPSPAGRGHPVDLDRAGAEQGRMGDHVRDDRRARPCRRSRRGRTGGGGPRPGGPRSSGPAGADPRRRRRRRARRRGRRTAADPPSGAAASATAAVPSASPWCRSCRWCRWSSWVLEADPAHLGHEPHPGRRLHTVAHQREQLVDIRRGGARFGLDEVGVLLRDHRAADPGAAQTGLARR